MCYTASGDADAATAAAAQLHTLFGLRATVCVCVGQYWKTSVMLSTIAVSLEEEKKLTNGVANAAESDDNDSGSLRRCAQIV